MLGFEKKIVDQTAFSTTLGAFRLRYLKFSMIFESSTSEINTFCPSKWPFLDNLSGTASLAMIRP